MGRKAQNGWNPANDTIARFFYTESVVRDFDDIDPLQRYLSAAWPSKKAGAAASAAPAAGAASGAKGKAAAATSLERKPSKGLIKAPWAHRRVPTTLEGTRSGGVVRTGK